MKLDQTLIAVLAVLCLACVADAGYRRRHHTSYVKHVEKHVTPLVSYGYATPAYSYRVTTVRVPVTTTRTTVTRTEPAIEVAPPAPSRPAQ